MSPPTRASCCARFADFWLPSAPRLPFSSPYLPLLPLFLHKYRPLPSACFPSFSVPHASYSPIPSSFLCLSPPSCSPHLPLSLSQCHLSSTSLFSLTYPLPLSWCLLPSTSLLFLTYPSPFLGPFRLLPLSPHSPIPLSFQVPSFATYLSLLAHI